MIGNNFSDRYLYNLYDLAVDNFDSGSVFVELGVHYGWSLTYLAQRVLKSGKDIAIYGIDLWDDDNSLRKRNYFHEFWQNVHEKGVDHIIRPICGDSSKSSSLFHVESVDFLFIDANHSYLCVRNDIESWVSRMKEGGWMCGHDYSLIGVKKAVTNIFNGKHEILGTCWKVNFD